jgi:hypothetical protein
MAAILLRREWETSDVGEAGLGRKERRRDDAGPGVVKQRQGIGSRAGERIAEDSAALRREWETARILVPYSI